MNSGGVSNNHIGNVVGNLGRGWNWNSNERPLVSFGYPQAAPFNGDLLTKANGNIWYFVNWGSGPDSQYMGNDMTGGSSGGPWVMGWNHANAERADTDANPQTDPGNQTIIGINSHKRLCGGGPCVPCGAAGALCTQEMGSPPFTTDPTWGSEGLWTFVGTL
jgi:hypothetical protein